MLNANLLTCFLAVMDHRTLTAAAQTLHISQPALSKSLRRLEDELAVPLFRRTAAGMEPTPYAMALAHRARLMEMESQRAREEIRLLKDGGVGSLTIGAGPLWSVYLLPQVVADLAVAYQGLRVRIVPGVLHTLLPRLLQGELDVLCSALDFPEHEAIEKEVLIESTHLILAHHSHVLSGAAHVDAAQLAQCAFVGINNDYAVLERMKRYFAQRGVASPGFAAEADSLEVLLSLVATGHFVATQSHQVLPRAQALGIGTLPIDGTIWSFEGGLAFRKAHGRSPALALFRQALHQRLQDSGEAITAGHAA